MRTTINEFLEVLKSADLARERKQEEARREADAATMEYLERRIAEWELAPLLNLGAVTVSEDGIARAEGAVTVDDVLFSVRVECRSVIAGFVGVTVATAGVPSRTAQVHVTAPVERVVYEITTHFSRLLGAVAERRKRQAESDAKYAAHEAEQAVALERGRKGAAILQQLAREYAEVAATQAAAAKAWAEEWTARLWQPWSGWLVRYAPVGTPHVDTESADNGLIQRVLILDDLAAVVAESPGVAVRAVSYAGRVYDLVIGAFLDAEPVECETARIDEELAYHSHRSVMTDAGWYYVNIPPTATERPLAPPECTTWPEWMFERVGDNAVAYEWQTPEIAQADIEKLASDRYVQALAEVTL